MADELVPLKILMVDLVVSGGHKFSFPALSITRRGSKLYFTPAVTNQKLALYDGIEDEHIIFLTSYERVEMVADDGTGITELVQQEDERGEGNES